MCFILIALVPGHIHTNDRQLGNNSTQILKKTSTFLGKTWFKNINSTTAAPLIRISALLSFYVREISMLCFVGCLQHGWFPSGKDVGECTHH